VNHALAHRYAWLGGDTQDAHLECCEALLLLGPSPGANVERAWAERLGLPIYTSVEEVPAVSG
jgi:NAD-dependent oxidoreductase involved in siderophore biosynthesis